MAILRKSISGSSHSEMQTSKSNPSLFGDKARDTEELETEADRVSEEKRRVRKRATQDEKRDKKKEEKKQADLSTNEKRVEFSEQNDNHTKW